MATTTQSNGRIEYLWDQSSPASPVRRGDKVLIDDGRTGTNCGPLRGGRSMLVLLDGTEMPIEISNDRIDAVIRG